MYELNLEDVCYLSVLVESKLFELQRINSDGYFNDRIEHLNNLLKKLKYKN